MGLITQLVAALFGRDGNTVKEIAEVFRVNAEAADERGNTLDHAALQQFAAEFVARNQRTWWDSLIDGLNRLPRPLLTLGVFWVLVWTVVDPVMMAEVFTAWSLIPEYAWALIALVVTFFFGGRQQVKDLSFKRDVGQVMAQAQSVLGQRRALRALDDPAPESGAPDQPQPPRPGASANPALDAWMASRRP